MKCDVLNYQTSHVYDSLQHVVCHMYMFINECMVNIFDASGLIFSIAYC